MIWVGPKCNHECPYRGRQVDVGLRTEMEEYGGGERRGFAASFEEAGRGRE